MNEPRRRVAIRSLTIVGLAFSSAGIIGCGLGHNAKGAVIAALGFGLTVLAWKI